MKFSVDHPVLMLVFVSSLFLLDTSVTSARRNPRRTEHVRSSSAYAHVLCVCLYTGENQPLTEGISAIYCWRTTGHIFWCGFAQRKVTRPQHDHNSPHVGSPVTCKMDQSKELFPLCVMTFRAQLIKGWIMSTGLQIHCGVFIRPGNYTICWVVNYNSGKVFFIPSRDHLRGPHHWSGSRNQTNCLSVSHLASSIHQSSTCGTSVQYPPPPIPHKDSKN